MSLEHHLKHHWNHCNQILYTWIML